MDLISVSCCVFRDLSEETRVKRRNGNILKGTEKNEVNCPGY